MHGMVKLRGQSQKYPTRRLGGGSFFKLNTSVESINVQRLNFKFRGLNVLGNFFIYGKLNKLLITFIFEVSAQPISKTSYFVI